jgi:hypothetical protein
VPLPRGEIIDHGPSSEQLVSTYKMTPKTQVQPVAAVQAAPVPSRQSPLPLQQGCVGEHC